MNEPRPNTVLHLGAHRTGTTSLQSIFQRNQDVLARENIAYWGPRKMRVPNLRDYYGEATNSPRNLETQAQIRAEMSQLVQDGVETLLISEENLLGTMEHNLKTQSLYATAGEKLRSYASVLGEAPERLVLSVRDYAEFWQSIYVFRLMAKKQVRPLDAIGLIEGINSRGWAEVVAEIRAAFPHSKITILRHNRADAFTQAALEACAGPHAGSRVQHSVPQSNGSLSQEGMAVLQAANAAFDGQWPAQMRGKLLKRLRDIPGTPFAVFTDAQRVHLNERFEADCQRIAGGEIPGVTYVDPREGDK